jgi:hypothetical protein
MYQYPAQYGYNVPAHLKKKKFFHVRLHPEARKYFGFAVPGKDGIVHYYQFTVMVYGLKSAVQVVTRLLLPLDAYIHKLGIRFSIYADDGRVVANTADKVFWQQKVVLHKFSIFGRLEYQLGKDYHGTHSNVVVSGFYHGFKCDEMLRPPQKFYIVNTSKFATRVTKT